MAAKRRRRTRQASIEFRPRGRGGARPGAGRPRTRRSRVAHRPRGPVPGRCPVLVTLRVLDDVPPLRRARFIRGVRAAECAQALLAAASARAARGAGRCEFGAVVRRLEGPCAAGGAVCGSRSRVRSGVGQDVAVDEGLAPHRPDRSGRSAGRVTASLRPRAPRQRVRPGRERESCRRPGRPSVRLALGQVGGRPTAQIPSRPRPRSAGARACRSPRSRDGARSCRRPRSGR